MAGQMEGDLVASYQFLVESMRHLWAARTRHLGVSIRHLPMRHGVLLELLRKAAVYGLGVAVPDV